MPCYLYPMSKRIAILADVQNIYYTTRQAYGRQFDYRKLWQQISAAGEIISATAYAIHRGDSQQLKFQNALKDIGFTVKLKPYIQRSDGSAKGDWDVGIAIDAMEIASDVDTLILLSGDGDFDLLLDRLSKKYGVSTEVYGVPALTANSLVDAAGIYHPIEEDLLL
ncbi:MAG: NYN domain-containing protein [Gammaproteobacteria bacterium]